MTSLGTLTYSETNRPNLAVIQPRAYLSNDRDAHQAWDGVWSALRAAGIAAPTAAMGAASIAGTGGSIADGTYLTRYRYRDSTSPQGRYRSDPSDAVSTTVTSGTGTATLTFTVGTSGTDIIRSTDPKVDTIVVERTLDGGSTYFVETEIANSGVSSVVLSLSDTNLANQDASASFGADFGHEPPPLSAVLFVCRGYAFACVYYAHTVTVNVSNGSATVTANSDSFADGWVGRLFLRSGDSKAYRISAVTQGSPDTLTLSETYAGVTGTGVTGTIYSSSPNRIYWSTQYYPESFKAASQAVDVMRDTDDVLVGGTEFLGDPWFFGRATLQRLVFATDPASSEVVTVSGRSGLWNQRCLIRPDKDSLFWFGQNGVWAIVGGQPRHISKKIDADWRDLLDYASTHKIHGAYDPEDRTVQWWFVPSGGSTPTRSLVYDLRGDRWRIDQFRQGIHASGVITDANGRLRTIISDATADNTSILGGATDGVPAADSNQGKYTAASGGTTTTTNTTESLPTGTGTDLSGLMLTSPDLGETVRITSNTANTITHAAFSAAIAQGNKVYAGSIPVVLETGWWVAADHSVDKRPGTLVVTFLPAASTLKGRVFLYQDFSATSTVWSKNTSRTQPKGVSWVAGQSYAEIDFSTADGVVRVPLLAKFGKAIKIKITVDDPAARLTIYDWAFTQGEAAEGAGE